MARIQRGSLIYRHGVKGDTWLCRYLETVIVNGQRRVIHRSKVLGFAREISQAQAERLRDALLLPFQTNYQPVALIQFESYFTQWETVHLATYRDSTRKFYHDVAKGYIYPFFKGRLLCDIHPMEVQAFVNSFSPGCSQSVLKHIRAGLNSLFKIAVTWGYLKDNPANGLRLPPGRPVTRAPVLSIEQIGALLQKLDPPYRGMVLLAATTAVRPSELFGLQWGDLDGKGQVINISRRLYRRHLGETKTPQSVRSIPVASEVLAELLQYRGESDALVFQGVRGGPVRSDEVLREHIMPSARTLGLPEDLTWRSFRRSAETIMHNSGVPLKTQQSVLGHKNPSTTLLYAESTEESRRQAAGVLGRLLGCANLPKLLTERAT